MGVPIQFSNQLYQSIIMLKSSKHMFVAKDVAPNFIPRATQNLVQSWRSMSALVLCLDRPIGLKMSLINSALDIN